MFKVTVSARSANLKEFDFYEKNMLDFHFEQ